MDPIGKSYYVVEHTATRARGDYLYAYIYENLRIYKTQVIKVSPKLKKKTFSPELPTKKDYYLEDSLDNLRARITVIQNSNIEVLEKLTRSFLDDYYLSRLGLIPTKEISIDFTNYIKNNYLKGKMPQDILDQFIKEELKNGDI